MPSTVTTVVVYKTIQTFNYFDLVGPKSFKPSLYLETRTRVLIAYVHHKLSFLVSNISSQSSYRNLNPWVLTTSVVEWFAVFMV